MSEGSESYPHQTSQEEVWYVYQKNQQLGPFSVVQVTQLIDSKMIAQDAYLFKVGWKDWRPIEDTYQELGMEKPSKDIPNRRGTVSPRASIEGRVIVHNNGQLVIGSGVNISSSGMFVETHDQLFKLGERLKLSVKVDAFAKAFNAVARVIRFNADARYPIGYGLQFEDLDRQVMEEIQQQVDALNRGEGPSDAGNAEESA